MKNEEDVEIRTWNKLWSRKNPEARLKNSRSIHPRNWGKARKEKRDD